MTEKKVGKKVKTRRFQISSSVDSRGRGGQRDQARWPSDQWQEQQKQQKSWQKQMMQVEPTWQRMRMLGSKCGRVMPCDNDIRHAK
jgi:hypothetical protein